jgi:CO/xanthine dehydrogenase FAD-binding subunit
MAIAHEFEYLKPATLAEATRTLAKYGPRAQVLAGGTDLVSLIAEDAAKPAVVVDIKGIRGLGGVALKGNALAVGALATFTDLHESPIVRRKFPVIREMTGWVASRGIRNRATMVGNICSAVPCCDSGPILLVYEADVLVQGKTGGRTVAVEDWFVGPRRTSIRKGELAVGVRIPCPREKHAACFVKQRRYQGEDLAQSSVTAMLLHGHRWRIAFGSVAPTPVRGRKIEKLLEGKKLTDALIRDAVKLVPQEIAPITDIRSSKEYRLHMVGVMLERGLRAAAARFEGAGPDYGTSLI